MKKLLVKIKVIDIPYSPLIPAKPEKWTKDDVEVFEEPKIEKVTLVPEKWTKDDLEVFEQPMIEVTKIIPEKWIKDDLEVFEKPMIEVDGVLVEDESFTYHPQSEVKEMVPDESFTYHEASELKELVFDESYTYHPFVPEVPEVLEESHEEIFAQTRGSDEELAVWLAGDQHRYPEGYWLEYIDITEEVNKQKAIQSKMELGRKARVACDSVLDLISGYNLDRELTVEQISGMQSAFAPIESALRSGRPSLAKALISQVEPDEVIVTEEMKSLVLELLSDY